MKKILSYPLSVVYFIFFGLLLVIFHPIQWICHNLLGYQAHKKSVDILNWFLMRSLLLLGTTVSFRNPHKIATNQPCIIVTNHQSMYDISPIVWHMRKHHPKFISKKELGKGIPSISYNLRHGGSALIDRKDKEQAFKEILKVANYAKENNRSIVIFPEGTRSRNGKPKRFQTGGLKILLKKIPNATVVPISINNSWKTLRYGKFPMGIGTHITFDVHTPIGARDLPPDELIAKIEETISSHINY
ncbi:lysophospholipid acyltransferase family protein [Galbibacter pacificus]|uniref:Lysophospholipid acyltransferase family protein n=1 Tax=Galbibacter pacificus TaxID=2996052 RepID=A0ABT6FTW7_9FLAO|nr:lysophospholipid acyltransferase family protein [Galbibacter pacificus]MDG3583230.1 lysophospholipid acyltransferase family protein [Galbibacter pacificus]MDG3586711.1 lysophospholipid acyltransferase family protein [Galbibacter pacificus]